MAYTARTASAEVLTTLAILKVQAGQGQDYLQNFLPFVAECIRTNAREAVTPKDLQEGFKKLFGFEVPIGVIQTLLRRAAKQGIVLVENRVYRPVREALTGLTIEKDREQAGQELDVLTRDFQRFVGETYGQEPSLQEAEDSLFEFISEHGVFSLVGGPSRVETLPTASSPTSSFLVGAFLQHLISSKSEQLSYFERAVQGSMLASVLQFENKVTVSASWHQASVYFDTPIILRIIGLYGEEVKAPYVELIELLRRQNVELHCFQPTLSEIDRVLGYIEDNLRHGRQELKVFEEMGENLLSASWSASDVRLERGRVERKLLAYGITPHELPRAQAHLTPEMARVEDIFQQNVGYRNDNARHHDIEATLAIHRLRNGLKPTAIERSVAIFVTNNFKVVNATREMFKECFGYRSEDVNACISAEVLTTIAWLKSNALLGGEATLPRKQLLADAYAAMKPSSELWNAYMAELQVLRADEMVSEADVLYLRCAPEAVSALARITLNDPAAFVEGTVEQVLDAARAANRFDAEQAQQAATLALAESEAARNRIDEERQAAVARTQQQAQDLSQLAAVAQQKEAELAQQQQQLQAKELSVQALDAKLAASAAHVAGRVRAAQKVTNVLRGAFFTIISFFLLSVAWIFTIKPNLPATSSQNWANGSFFHSPILIAVALIMKLFRK